MKNKLKIIAIAAFLAWNFKCLAASSDALFSREDSSEQQRMLQQFKTYDGSTNLSVPPGPYLKECSDVAYDTLHVRGDCNDVTQRKSFFDSYYTVGGCGSLATTSGGFLRCDDK